MVLLIMKVGEISSQKVQTKDAFKFFVFVMSSIMFISQALPFVVIQQLYWWNSFNIVPTSAVNNHSLSSFFCIEWNMRRRTIIDLRITIIETSQFFTRSLNIMTRRVDRCKQMRENFATKEESEEEKCEIIFNRNFSRNELLINRLFPFQYDTGSVYGQKMKKSISFR